MSNKADTKAIAAYLYDVIDSPVVTEKAQTSTQFSKYTFNVAPEATKTTVKKAVEAIFGVTVNAVNILNRKGKNKVFKGRHGRRKDVKRAIVTLAEGQNLDIEVNVSK